MIIDITGESKSLSKEETLQAIEFCASLLFTKSQRNRIVLTVDYDRLPKTYYGFCEKVLKDEFIITIHKTLGKKNTLCSLFHEMVHVNQYSRGHLYDYYGDRKKMKWRGKIIKNYERKDYWDWEWEIEAHGREHGLYVRYMQHVKTLEANKNGDTV